MGKQSTFDSVYVINVWLNNLQNCDKDDIHSKQVNILPISLTEFHPLVFSFFQDNLSRNFPVYGVRPRDDTQILP